MRVLVAVIAGALAACRGGGKPHRTGNDPPVEIVKQPALPDAGGVGRGGPVTDEVEPNDTNDVATPLPLGGTVRGKIEPDTDVDRYRIDVDRAGALSVLTSAVDADLVVELEDAGGNVLARSARGAVRLREGVPNFAVTPGRYVAVVRAAPKKPVKKPPRKRGAPPPKEEPKPAPVYELTAQLVAPGSPAPGAPRSAGEVEPNDDRGTANDLLVGDTVTGYIGWTGDADAWKLNVEGLSNKNALAVTVSPVEGIVLELEIEDAAGQVLLVHKGARGEGVALHKLAPTLAAGAPPFVYIVVRGDRSNCETPYQLAVEASLLDADDEREPDDTPDRAFAIPAERAAVRGTWDYGDIDCYAIAATTASRAIEIAIDPPAELDVAAELYVDGSPTMKVDHPGKGVAEKIATQVAPGTRVVACVRAVGDAPTKGTFTYGVHVQDVGPGDAQ